MRKSSASTGRKSGSSASLHSAPQLEQPEARVSVGGRELKAVGWHVAVSAGPSVAVQTFQPPVEERNQPPEDRGARFAAAIQRLLCRRSSRFPRCGRGRGRAGLDDEREQQQEKAGDEQATWCHGSAFLGMGVDDDRPLRLIGAVGARKLTFVEFRAICAKIQAASHMTQGKADDITHLLLAWNAGDAQALDRLMPLVHTELHRLAHRHMAGERPGHQLQTTALVNEAYLRLIDSSRVGWQDRTHFFAVSAQLMRRILVDFARSRNRLKRGGDVVHVPLTEAEGLLLDSPVDSVALDNALVGLAALDERKSRVVELRFFGGLTVEETADVLKVSSMTVMRDWDFAKAWLRRELRSGSRAG